MGMESPLFTQLEKNTFDVIARCEEKKVLSIDPGKKNIGWAVFTMSNKLLSAGFLHDKTRIELIKKMGEMAVRTGSFYIIISEWPVIYRSRYSRGNPNDLLGLSATIGAVQTVFSYDFFEIVEPRVWKGQVPKHIHHPRILSQLSETERQMVESISVSKSKQHNVIDAIGIGQYLIKNRSKKHGK